MALGMYKVAQQHCYSPGCIETPTFAAPRSATPLPVLQWSCRWHQGQLETEQSLYMYAIAPLCQASGTCGRTATCVVLSNDLLPVSACDEHRDAV
jgi:hypothetical protein